MFIFQHSFHHFSSTDIISQRCTELSLPLRGRWARPWPLAPHAMFPGPLRTQRKHLKGHNVSKWAFSELDLMRWRCQTGTHSLYNGFNNTNLQRYTRDRQSHGTVHVAFFTPSTELPSSRMVWYGARGCSSLHLRPRERGWFLSKKWGQ